MNTYIWIAAIVLIILATGLFVSSSSNPSSPNSDTTGNFIGTTAPDFILSSTSGESVSLSDYKGKYNVLLYFQEGVMCPPCWTQMVDIERRINEFDTKDIKILTITTDRLYQSQNYVKQSGTNLPVLADEDRAVSKMYDALKDSMHPGETPGHLFVLIDKTEIIRWRYSAYAASTTGDHHGGGGRMYVPVDEILDGISRSL